MELMWLIWIGLMVVFAIVEASTVSMVSLWFIGGSLGGLIVTLVLLIAIVLTIALPQMARRSEPV